MKKVFYLLMSIVVLCSCEKQVPLKLNVMTFNIRMDNPGDSLNSWPYRKDIAANAVLFYDVDVLGTQEVLHHQLEDMKQRLPGYESLGVGRADGKEKGEYSAIFYKKDRFTVLESGTFWLSETPEAVGKKGWDAACERVATWGKFKDKESGKEFFALNTHFDHIGEIARKESVNLILTKTNELAGNLPIVVTGDFNAEPETDVIKAITDSSNEKHLTDSRSISPIIYGPQWSFHDFERIPYAERPLIDYVFVKNGFKALRYGVLAETKDSTCLSDHAPVLVQLTVDN